MNIAATLKKITQTSIANEVERLQLNASAIAESLTAAGTDQVAATRGLQEAERVADRKAVEAATGLIKDADEKISRLRLRQKATAAALAEAKVALADEDKASRIVALRDKKKAAGAAADAAQDACVVALLEFRAAFVRYVAASSDERSATDAIAREAADVFPMGIGLRSLGRIERLAKTKAGTLTSLTVEIPN
jgi:hypothetical protein